MTNKYLSKYALLMDRLAAPLVEGLYAMGPDAVEGEEFARNFATLLNRSVTLGGKITQRFELETETQEDRINAMAMAAGLLSKEMIHSGTMPTDGKAPVPLQSLDGLMSFAEDFIADMDEDADAMTPIRPMDILPAGAALVDSVHQFAFGREVDTMMSELTLGLRARMKQWMKGIPQTDSNQTPSDRLHILGAGLTFLAQAYDWRVQAVEKSNASPEADPALLDIWTQFDEKMTMLKAVLLHRSRFTRPSRL